MTTSTEQLDQVAVNDIGSQEELLAAIDKTIKYFGDGDIVTGTLVLALEAAHLPESLPASLNPQRCPESEH